MCDRSSILKVLDINQDGGKSIMAQNYVSLDAPRNPMIPGLCILDEWVEVINMNACAILTCWWG
jgi:hypothetical protein